MKARLARNARMAYSVKCPAFRVRKCTAANRASLRLGKSHNSMGRTTVEVLAAENSSVDANEMKSIHNTSGPYRQNRRRADWGCLIIGLKAQREAADAASLY